MASTKMVRPIMSLDLKEARRRSLGLYKAVYRFIPYITRYFDIPKSESDVRLKARELFYRNSRVVDVRVIDVLVLKGYMELKEMTHNWQQKGRVMAYWNPTLEPQPSDFVGKFLNGHD